MSARALRTALLVVAALASGCSDPQTNTVSPVAPAPAATPPAPTPDIDGEYTLTFTASVSCSLPEPLRRRTYTARVSQRGANVSAWLEGAHFADAGNFLGGTRNGDWIDFDISWGWGFGVAEVLDDRKVLYYEGTARAAVTGGKITTGTFNGVMRLYRDESQMLTTSVGLLECSAADHRMEFIWR